MNWASFQTTLEFALEFETIVPQKEAPVLVWHRTSGGWLDALAYDTLKVLTPELTANWARASTAMATSLQCGSTKTTKATPIALLSRHDQPKAAASLRLIYRLSPHTVCESLHKVIARLLSTAPIGDVNLTIPNKSSRLLTISTGAVGGPSDVLGRARRLNVILPTTSTRLRVCSQTD